MKKLLTTLLAFAALIIFLIVNDSVYSQKVISSVNAANNVVLISENLKTNNTSTIVLENKAENWMSNKNYLDASTSDFNYSIMNALNEKVYESDKKLEDWMFEEAEWVLTKLVIETFDEERLLEEWMFDTNFLKIKDEDENSIEDWMLDDKFWVMVN